MEPSKKNTPAPVVIIGLSAMLIAVISYLILLFFFPELLQNLPTGEAQPFGK